MVRMEDKLIAVKVSLRILLARIEEIKIPGQVNYELEQKVKGFSEKIYELAVDKRLLKFLQGNRI